VRPGEMLSLKEGNIDLANAYFYFPHPKEKKFKSVPLIPEDVDILKSFALSFPGMPFFRHGSGVKGTPENHPFSKNILYNWWKKACENLGVVGVDLYGGTRHSSVRALRKYHSPETLKRAAGSSTNKAFDRYFGKEEDADLRTIYFQSAKVIPFAPATGMIPEKKGVKK
jgi:integrase